MFRSSLEKHSVFFNLTRIKGKYVQVLFKSLHFQLSIHHGFSKCRNTIMHNMWEMFESTSGKHSVLFNMDSLFGRLVFNGL